MRGTAGITSLPADLCCIGSPVLHHAVAVVAVSAGWDFAGTYRHRNAWVSGQQGELAPSFTHLILTPWSPIVLKVGRGGRSGLRCGAGWGEALRWGENGMREVGMGCGCWGVGVGG